MPMNLDKNMLFERFVSCVSNVGLLIILSQAAGCARAGESFLISTAGSGFTGDFQLSLPMPIDLTGCGIFRGKVSRRKNQNQKNHLEERTQPRLKS